MKKLVLALFMVLLLLGFAQAGPATRSLSVFPHTDESITIPESGAYLEFQEENGIAYYRWDKLSKEEFCEEEGLVDQWINHPKTCYKDECVKRDKWGRCTKYEKVSYDCSYKTKDFACTEGYEKCAKLPQGGEGTELPSYLDGADIQPVSQGIGVMCEPPQKTGQCYDVEQDTAFFKKDISIGFGIPGSIFPYEALVVRSCLGNTIQVAGTGHTFRPMETIKTRFLVWKMPDKAGQVAQLMLKTDWIDTPVNPDGMFSSELEGGFTFTGAPGVYKFSYRVEKPDGTIGTTKAKVMVYSCVKPE